ncbi:DUF2934 domain-containing protein [Rhizobium jaguaris]|uniref:DUF2934 domain-containing protein n=2 Tax=Rhizobium jaguaris TaxID=1312183 RepID=A0A387G117_9HYPH|nr:DUF2934 domain-containing protein [Rhizobium jaguaris]
MPTEQGHEWIKKRAYSLWEEAGHPHGRDQDHWNQAVAEREDLERTQASVDGNEVLVKYKKKAGSGKADGNEVLVRYKKKTGLDKKVKA